MESPRLAARRATLYSLHISALTGGFVALAVRLVFHDLAAALVSSSFLIAGGLLALLSHRSPTLGLSRRAAVRGALLEGYGVALLVVGGLILRGAGGHVAPARERLVAELASGAVRSCRGAPGLRETAPGTALVDRRARAGGINDATC